MKKTLIALAILGGTVGAVHAQSSLTIYGSADISYVKSTGNSVTMSGGAERPLYYEATASDNTYLGFMGAEDLGGGLKATFQLEQRFNLSNGQSAQSERFGKVNGKKSLSGGTFDGASNVGLAGAFGQVRFGRVNELSTETYRRIDPFDQNGVASALLTPFRGDDDSGRLSYTARYDSPSINGFNFGASYTVKNGPDYNGPANNGYAVSGTYTNGPMYLVANYNKAVNSGGSYNWNVGGAYSFGPLKLSLGYEDSKWKYDGEKVSTWIVGAAYTVGSGVFNAAYSHMDDDSGASGYKDTKYAIGYTYNLSKRTSVYANYAHVKAAPWGGADGGDGYSFNTAEVGITHKF